VAYRLEPNSLFLHSILLAVVIDEVAIPFLSELSKQSLYRSSSVRLTRIEDWVLARRNGTNTASTWLELNIRSAFAALTV
jgi:hypothetical protein